MKKIREALKLNNNYKRLLLIIASLVLLILLGFETTRVITYNIEKREAQELPEIAYKVYSVNKNMESQVLVTFSNENGIKTIEDFTGNIINANGKMKVSIDYKMLDRTTYLFKITYSNGTKKELPLEFEIPRRKGNYVKKNDAYINAPDIKAGFNELTTRYIYMDENGNMVPGDWLNGEEPENWYDYNNSNWANIYAESEGVESYYVWIPRYCYKIDEENSIEGNERVDVKFINTYDEYINASTGEKLTWDQLEADGYIIPEAFLWDNVIIPGYWMSKYQLSDKTNIKLNFDAVEEGNSIKTTITTNTLTDVKFIYAIDGEKKATTTLTSYSFNNVEQGKRVINVTAVDNNGCIVASMTKTKSIVEPNKPDLTGFNKDQTYYVTGFDSNGDAIIGNNLNESEPSNWYNYGTRNWANIVVTDGTVSNGKITGATYTSYFVWIPRYAYYINPELAAVQAPNERVTIQFIEGTSTETENGYIIPEAFTWGDDESNMKQLTGYWMSKYQLSN